MSEWQSLVRGYLSSRKTLKRVCLLIDSRHGLKPKDIEAIELFERCDLGRICTCLQLTQCAQ